MEKSRLHILYHSRRRPVRIAAGAIILNRKVKTLILIKNPLITL